MQLRTVLLAGVASLSLCAPALADVTICVTVSATGPAASLGAPEYATIPMLPTEIGGETVNYVAFDDATDPTAAVRNVRKCIEEDSADLIIGSSATPGSIAVAGVGAETGTPVISLSPVGLEGEANEWTFRAPQNVSQMASALIGHMEANGVTTLGAIGYSDAYGDQWFAEMERALEGTGITMAPVERYARNDTSVTGQVLRIVSANPDAVLVVSSGTPGALPNIALGERGYDGQIYHTHGSASLDFIRVAGEAAEGTVLPVGPIVVAEQLPDDHPSKDIGMKYTAAYEDENGADSVSSFGGHMYDAGQLAAAAIPVALEAAEPGTDAFRSALRDALEGVEEVVGVHGVFNMTPEDHFGHDERSRVLVTIEGGAWKYME
ncbi:ABC transporter substrate-binding protein [Pararhizobium haloflavum]|uniref:ABC transporter substrate-binding protein n=1 Tax=Pararhizobium haloflavum TaxID=2037914 RepID=UPI000C199B8B|nr:ABC transporter substrate-binding protein [Pararhizobium haloflavum]